MRVVCDVKIPEADGYGNTHTSRYVSPYQNSIEEIQYSIRKSLESIKNFKSGVEIKINIEEDWNYDES